MGTMNMATNADEKMMEVANVDKKLLRTWLGQYATGVTIVTTVDENGKKVGMTANSFTSVSLEPPLVLWNIAKNATYLKAFCEREYFAINILSEEQHLESNHFSKPAEDKFSGIDSVQELKGLPVLENALTTFICKSYQIHEAGDHFIIVGEIKYCRHNGGRPLVFHNGKYHEANLHRIYKD
ncbi:flavin reductase family protein [Acinetobacter stercoris]|uniref:p-hydroxyphenylacetate 3-hydroxylase, reductase component n=1 Tax=Acinetobacter stercoris TaxID=2126983 RepID=A0A2U3N4G9_9GAMM|nr:flavin reductase family protein [Acinetobacter stercoris]SPL72562.1 p-hydroxyphenylacetate 3-hydroxylase, reductase component [Acinetobacter stercoris]